MELKEPLIGQAKNRAFKRLELGTVPQEWAEVSLFEAAGNRKDRFDDGDWVEAEFITDEGVRLIQTGNIGSGVFLDKSARKYVSEGSFQLLGCKEIRQGDLLISRLAAPAGRSCILPDIGEKKMITSVDVTIVRPVEEIAIARYLNQLFLTREWFEVVALRCGGTTHSRIPRSELGKIILPLPKPEEQRAIATALSDVDALLGSLDAWIAKKKAIKQGTMQQLLTGKQRLKGFEGEWEVKTFGEVAGRIVGGGTPSRARDDYWGHEIPWVAVKDFTSFDPKGTKEWITKTGLASSASNLIPKGCLIVATRIALGQALIYEVDVAINQDLKGILPSEKLHARFMYYWFQQFGKVMIEKGAGSTVLGVLLSDLRSLELFMPPTVQEQSAIATVLSDMDAEISALEARRAKTALLKQGMMQELLTGRTRLV